jgi:hypothetical protein
MRFIFLFLVVFVASDTSVYAQLFGGQLKRGNTVVTPYPVGSVFCASGPTAVVDVTNPATGKIWMDRNLGATQAATSSIDTAAYGDLYQWGRGSDGHQCRTSPTTSTLSSTDQPGHGNFITINSGNYDWRSPQNNNLWQGVNGVNNPCPSGYRLPTVLELNEECSSWSSNNYSGAFASPLKWTMASLRFWSNGIGTYPRGWYWGSTVFNSYASYLLFESNVALTGFDNRGNGASVRCIKDIISPLVGTINTLDCNGASSIGTLTQSIAASGVSSSVPYTGGNGGSYSGQTVNSTGVTGLTATLIAGTFANGSGNLTYTISGTPIAAGTASFVLNIGGQSCTLNDTILPPAQPAYPVGSVFCASGPTAVVDVTNPTTGKKWMDRNLGASQVATSSTDANSYGDLFQWGRRADGHQCRTSTTTTTLSSSNQPTHGSFIKSGVSGLPHDWRSPQNTNLWQGVNGINNPCPSGYRLPTETELDGERLSWSSNNAAGAFASPLKLPKGGARDYSGGQLGNIGTAGIYWSSTVGTVSSYGDSRGLYFDSSSASMYNEYRASGLSVRCIKN